MPNYYVTLDVVGKKRKRVSICSIDDEIEGTEDETNDEVCDEFTAQLLDYKRTKRFKRVFENFEGDYNKEEDVSKHLHEKGYIYLSTWSDNLSMLKQQMCSIYELYKKYTIEDVEKLPDCIGCAYSSDNALLHLNCDNGCFHDPKLCEKCKGK